MFIKKGRYHVKTIKKSFDNFDWKTHLISHDQKSCFDKVKKCHISFAVVNTQHSMCECNNIFKWKFCLGYMQKNWQKDLPLSSCTLFFSFVKEKMHSPFLFRFCVCMGSLFFSRQVLLRLQVHTRNCHFQLQTMWRGRENCQIYPSF